MTYESHKGEIVKLAGSLSTTAGVSRGRVFRDFIEGAACELSSVVRPNPKRAQRLTQILEDYPVVQRPLFGQMLGELTLALECRLGDALGEIFMAMELGDSRHGQFFTPYPVCKLMASMQRGLTEVIEAHGFATVCDPACGAGATLIAIAEHVLECDYNFQQHLHITATDLDIRAAHMCFVQLSLIGAPAVVFHGNSLTGEQFSAWETPFHHLGLWDARLKARELLDVVAD